MTAPNDLLELSVEELRRYYDQIAHDHDQTRIKILTLLGGGLALLSFLYAGGDLFIPPQLYGRIFYAAGIASLIIAEVVFFWATRPSLWAIPTEIKEMSKLGAHYKDRAEFLTYLKEEYLEAIQFCKSQLGKKVQLLDIGGNLLFVGAIILLVIKYFGGR